MKRDICHYYAKTVPEVFEAYRQAAEMKFGKNTNAEPYHTISFGLNYSFKYNMNGGSCTVHFMPYQGGTAVDVRYTIVQLFGARYGAYDKELTTAVEGNLGVMAQDITIPVETFLNDANKMFAGAQPAPQAQPVQQPVQQAVPVQQAQPVQTERPAPKFCCKCGTPVTPGSNFCGKCGNKLR